MSELKLLAAILVRAEKDLRGNAKWKRSSAFDWINSRVERPYSFEWVCENLGLDSEYVRRKILVKRRSHER